MTLLPFFLFLFTVSLFESFLVTDSIYPAIVGILRNGYIMWKPDANMASLFQICKLLCCVAYFAFI